jgi:thymidylate kinase
VTLRVDVILPAHGGERWIAEAVESVLAQTWPHWRLTVVDDASPDGSAEIADAYARARPDRIEVLRLARPRRAAGARMEAIAATRGDVIAFLDQDDRWRPEKLARQVALFEADPALGAVHTDCEIIDAHGAIRRGAADGENVRRAAVAWDRGGPELAAALFRKNLVRLASAAVRRSAFEAAGGFDVSLFGGEDWEFWVRFAERFAIAHLAEPLLERRVHGGNTSRARAAERVEGKLRALEKLAREHPFLAPHVPARREALAAEAREAEAARPLALATELFARLAAAGVRYCHWKSNEHLAAALAGRTDFDLLVDPADRVALDGVLDALGFAAVIAAPNERYPGTWHRLGFDAERGALVHLHLHDRLVLGAPGVKNHQLPLEGLALDGGRELSGVRAPSAEVELLLLSVRALVKVSPLRLARRWRADGTKTLQSALVREMEFLLADAEPERFRAAVRESGLPLPADALFEFTRRAAARALTTPEIARLRRRVMRAIAPWRRETGLGAAWRELGGRALRTRWLRRWLAGGGKTLPGGGRIFALVGADGAGKSTLARDLRAWLGWKLAVEPAYFGLPRHDWRWRALERARRRLGWRWLDAERWMLAARSRVAAWKRAERLAARGGVVIADRWPLPELWQPPQPMDGPRLVGHPWAAREAALYARIPRPSRIFVLEAPLAVLRERKPEVEPALHARKAAVVAALSAADDVERVDASRPYDEVLLDLKRRIWARL